MSSVTETAATQATSPSVFILNVTDRAVDKVKDFAAKTPDAAGKALRVFIQGGGCSGFQYGFTFDEKRPTDHVLAVRDIEVIVDPQSALKPVSYTHLRAHETDSYLVCRLLLE